MEKYVRVMDGTKSNAGGFDNFLDISRKDNIKTEKEANDTHYTIEKNIREVMAKNDGTMPENLPTPKKSLKQLKKEYNKSLRKK